MTKSYIMKIDIGKCGCRKIFIDCDNNASSNFFVYCLKTLRNTVTDNVMHASFTDECYIAHGIATSWPLISYCSVKGALDEERACPLDVPTPFQCPLDEESELENERHFFGNKTFDSKQFQFYIQEK